MKVLVTDNYNQQALDKLTEACHCDIKYSKQHQPTEAELQNTNILLIRSKTKINELLLKKATQLKLIITSTSGFDHIDLTMTEAYGIKVMYTPSANIQSVAELTFNLFLELARKTRQSSEAIHHQLWKSSLPLATEISNKNLSIIGLGRIGSQVAKIAQAFNMKVAAFDPYIPDKNFQTLNVERLDFIATLKHAEFLTLHLPLTKKTHHLINTSNINHLSNSAFIVNTSRGQVIEENQLYQALKQQQIAGAALDVFNHEPLSSSDKLLTLKNFIATPHIGAYTAEAYDRASNDAITKTIHFIRDGIVTDSLPPKAEWFQKDQF